MKCPNIEDLDYLEKKIFKHLWNNVSIDISIRNRNKLEEEMYRQFSISIAKLYRKFANNMIKEILDFAVEEQEQ